MDVLASRDSNRGGYTQSKDDAQCKRRLEILAHDRLTPVNLRLEM
jgi:hypothetical protein